MHTDQMMMAKNKQGKRNDLTKFMNFLLLFQTVSENKAI